MHRVAVHRLPVQDVQTASTRTVDARSNVCTDTEKSTANCRHNDAKATPATKEKRAGTVAKREKSWHCSLELEWRVTAYHKVIKDEKREERRHCCRKTRQNVEA